MTIQEIYDLAIQMGIKADPRGEEGIKKYLKRVNKIYNELPPREKEFFDKTALTNPFADSKILLGDGKKTVKRVLVGIDIDSGEVVLADRLADKGKKIDLIIGHHPHGNALSTLDEVMNVQVDLASSFGVPENVAEALLSERVSQVKRRLGPSNHFQSVDTARLLDLPFMVLHTAWDNLGFRFLTNEIEKNKNKFDTVGDVFDLIQATPEFKETKKNGAGPMLTVGSRNNRPGKVVVSGFTGGTEGSKLIYEKYADAGVGTIIEMHMSEEHFEQAKKYHLNVIVSGHMASDSLGANIFLDQIEKKGVEVIPCSGLIRVRRSK